VLYVDYNKIPHYNETSSGGMIMDALGSQYHIIRSRLSWVVNDIVKCYGSKMYSTGSFLYSAIN